MNPLSMHPAYALDHALRSIDEEVRRAEARRLARELRQDPARRRTGHHGRSALAHSHRLGMILLTGARRTISWRPRPTPREQP